MTRFDISRSVTISADRERVHALVDDLHRWPSWSPWEGTDPDLRRTYTGPERGVGAHYAWAGNAKAGEGSMEITSSDPARVVLDLRFVKPFRAVNVTTFAFEPAAGGTRVTWTMTGRRNPVMDVVGRLVFDRTLRRDFDRGLASLKAQAEG